MTTLLQFIDCEDRYLEIILAEPLTYSGRQEVCIQNQALLGTTVRVRRQLNLTGGTVR